MISWYLALVVVAATCFLNPVNGVIGFDQASYEIAEDIGLDNFALRVCILAEEEDRSVTISTSAGTATDFEDFDPFHEVLDVEAGSDDGCVAIVILEDEYFEDNETFSISLLDESGSELSEAIVTIVNDDASDLFIRFVEDTPLVVGTQVTFSLELGPAVEQAICAVVFRSSTTEVDCTSGFVTIPTRRRRGQHQVVVRVSSPVVENPPTIVRDIHLGVSRRCSVNLINDGVVVNRNVGEATVSFRLTEQDGVDPSQVTFTCTVSGPVPGSIPLCNSPLVLSALTPGDYELVVTANKRLGGCRGRIDRIIQFTI